MALSELLQESILEHARERLRGARFQLIADDGGLMADIGVPDLGREGRNAVIRNVPVVTIDRPGKPRFYLLVGSSGEKLSEGTVGPPGSGADVIIDQSELLSGARLELAELALIPQ